MFVVTQRTLPATGSTVPLATVPTTPREKSLYERLGGEDAIYRLMSDFTDALDANAPLNRQNPKVAAARMRVKPEDRKKKLADFIGKLTGGPGDYMGRPLKEAHAPLSISEADWAIAGEELMKVLSKHNVPKAEQDALLAAIEATKADIVTKRS